MGAALAAAIDNDSKLRPPPSRGVGDISARIETDRWGRFTQDRNGVCKTMRYVGELRYAVKYKDGFQVVQRA